MKHYLSPEIMNFAQPGLKRTTMEERLISVFLDHQAENTLKSLSYTVAINHYGFFRGKLIFVY